jgi:hydroxypyruvate isomerase
MPSLDRRAFLNSAAALGAVGGLSAIAGSGTVAQAAQAPRGDLGKTPHTRFAVNVEMWWRDLPFLERVRKAAEFGYPAFEFWPWQSKDLDALASITRQLGIAVAQFTAWGFRPGLNHPDNHDAFVEAIRAGCEVAKKLDCKLMTVVGGDDQPGMTQQEMHKHIIAGLKRGAPIAEDNDITLILGPMNIRVDHKGHCLYGSEPAVRICEAVASTHVKINWDLYHMQLSEGDLCGHLRDGFAWVGYLQLADTPGRNEPGTGEIHYSRVLKEAYDLGYRGYVGLECRPKTSELAAAQAVVRADVW